MRIPTPSDQGSDRPVAAPSGDRALPAAVVSLHSHRDRSFLDDVRLHHISGALRAAGLANDLVVGWLPPGAEAMDGGPFGQLVDALRPYSTILYERLWSASIAVRLREALPGKTFVRLFGGNDLPGAPADHVCDTDPRQVVALLLRLSGRSDSDIELPRYAPNLHPVYATPEARPAFLSFPLMGNAGCPYRSDVRDNPLFAGARIPEGVGYGCSFCTNGRRYEHKPKDDALAWVLEQLRYLRSRAPELKALVLRDQNPFYYLPELVEAAQRESLGPFNLLVESRADWFLHNEARFVRAIECAQRSSISLSPFLVGVENFSQPELDRFNKGATVETQIRFLETLGRWHKEYAPALDLAHTAFGFILFTPWTTLQDLEANLQGIRRTGMHQLRGFLLLSRIRLYPDTALYWLAERDGVLADAHERPQDDASARYGYLPARPFRFLDPRVARIAQLAEQVLSSQEERDEPALLETLLSLVGKAERPELVTAEQVVREMGRGRQEGAAARGRRTSAVFRDPQGLEQQAAQLKRRVAQALVRSPELPVFLPAFGLSLLDIGADKRGIDLVLGPRDPVARLRVTWDRASERAVVTTHELTAEARRWSRAFGAMSARLRQATRRDRFEQALQPARELARLPVAVPLEFFRQIVAGVEPAEGLVRTGFACNQNCGMCWQSRDWPAHGRAQVMRWIEDLSRAGARSLIISGGEPTLDPDLPTYVSTARELGFDSVTLETNAILLARSDRAGQLAAAGLTHAFVSLHSGDAAVSDAITRAPGTHARTLQGIRALLDAGVAVLINAVMTAQGLEALGELPDFLHAEFGAHPLLRSLMLSYPTEPYDPALLTTVVPDPSRLRRALRAALDSAAARGVVVRGLDGPCGPPLCAFDADERFTSRQPVRSPVDFRRHVPACEACEVRPSCFGVRNMDVQQFGEACVRPIGQPSGAPSADERRA